jgi:hypothetical protein
MGMFIRRACAAFKAEPCEGHADLVARIQSAMRGAEVRLTQLLAASEGGGERGGEEEAADEEALGGKVVMARLRDPEVHAALGHARAIVSGAIDRVEQSLAEAEDEFGFAGSSGFGSSGGGGGGAQRGSAAAAGAGAEGAAALRGGDALGMYYLRRVADAELRPVGCPPAPRRALLGGGYPDGTSGAAAAAAEAEGKLRALQLDLPQRRYLDLMDAINSKDGTACVDALHRLFDVAGAGGGKGQLAAAGGGDAAPGECGWLVGCVEKQMPALFVCTAHGRR